jgi:hypothetical protein
MYEALHDYASGSGADWGRDWELGLLALTHPFVHKKRHRHTGVDGVEFWSHCDGLGARVVVIK